MISVGCSCRVVVIFDFDQNPSVAVNRACGSTLSYANVCVGCSRLPAAGSIRTIDRDNAAVVS
jgi:hypothetical protein